MDKHKALEILAGYKGQIAGGGSRAEYQQAVDALSQQAPAAPSPDALLDRNNRIMRRLDWLDRGQFVDLAEFRADVTAALRQQPVQTEDNRRIVAALEYLRPNLEAGTFAASDWAIDLGSILTGGSRLRQQPVQAAPESILDDAKEIVVHSHDPLIVVRAQRIWAWLELNKTVQAAPGAVGEVRIADGCIVSTSIKRPLPDGGYDIVPQAAPNPQPSPTDEARTSPVDDAMVNKALHARVPGGAEVWHWLPQDELGAPHATAYCVMHAALEAALRPQ